MSFNNYQHHKIFRLDFKDIESLIDYYQVINGKIVSRIYQVDYNNEPEKDIYLPWLFYLSFKDFDYFLEIEGDIDGQHLRVNLYETSELEDRLARNNFPGELDLWQVYEVNREEKLGQLLGRKIDSMDFGIDQEIFQFDQVNLVRKEYISFIRIYCEDITLTIFEGSASYFVDVSIKDLPKTRYSRYIRPPRLMTKKIMLSWKDISKVRWNNR